MSERLWMVHPELPGQRISTHPEGVGIRQASGWVLDDDQEAPIGPATPAYVHRLLDAYLTGEPLDFAGTAVPADVRARLEQVMSEAKTGTTDRPGRSARRVKTVTEEQE